MEHQIDYLITVSFGIVVLAGMWIGVLVVIPLIIVLSIKDEREERRREDQRQKEKEAEAAKREQERASFAKQNEKFLQTVDDLYVRARPPMSECTVDTTGKVRD